MSEVSLDDSCRRIIREALFCNFCRFLPQPIDIVPQAVSVELKTGSITLRYTQFAALAVRQDRMRDKRPRRLFTLEQTILVLST